MRVACPAIWFLALFLFDIFVLLQKSVDILVSERLTGAVLVDCVINPFKLGFNIGSMRLFFDALKRSLLLCVAYLCPTIMSCDFRSRVGIDHRNYRR